MLVYLCGPIDLRERDHDWRTKAEKILISHNFNVYNPEGAFSFFEQGKDTWPISDCRKLSDINTFALKASDIIIANITGCPTVGTYTELYETRLYGKCTYAAVSPELYHKSVMLKALLKQKFIYPDIDSLLTHIVYLDKKSIIKGVDILVG